MLRFSVLLVSTLLLSACGGSGGGVATTPLQTNENQASELGSSGGENENTASNQNLFPVAVDNTGGNENGQQEQTQSPYVPTVTNAGESNGVVAPSGNLGGNIDANPLMGRVSGKITVLNDSIPVGDVYVTIRGTDEVVRRDENGDFSLPLPESNTDQTVVVEITGENIINKSIELHVPANAEQVGIDAVVGAHNPPMTFNLETVGEYFNDDGTTGASVSIPANALEYADGTLATGDAQLSITEIDIFDLEGDSAWVPPLIGLSEGMTEADTIHSFGMADYTFSQNGEELNLRPGVQATIKMHLQVPYRLSDDIPPQQIEIVAGDKIPLWYYDDERMLWIEEGEATVFEDADSPTGLSWAGPVSHFTPWNGDIRTTNATTRVHVNVVDQNGDSIPGLTATSWNANGRSMTPVQNTISTPYFSTQQPCATCDVDSWYEQTSVTISVNNVVVSGLAQRYSAPPSQTISFTSGVGPYSATFEVVIDMTPEEMPVTINLVVEDLDENRLDVEVASFQVTAETIGDSWSNQKTIVPNPNHSPVSGQINVQANTVQMMAAINRAISTRISVGNIVLGRMIHEGEPTGPTIGAITTTDELSVTSLYKAFEGPYEVTFTVVADIEGRSR